MNNGKQLILLVEDDPVLRDLTGRQITVLGFESVLVGTGEEAVAKTSDNTDIAMIFMDIGLPGIDGNHATLIIREQELIEHRKRIPIIALTAHSDAQRTALAGMDDFLQKPALLNDIKRMTDKWIKS
ncbi:MAG: response regulator [Candidatus Obscuribacterales bacterium]|nr:response regulator [Candidatus Obscuribacterales bacterium]